MKLETEFRWGMLAFTLYGFTLMLLVFVILILSQKGDISLTTSNTYAWYITGANVFCVIYIFYKWIDKFNYLED